MAGVPGFEPGLSVLETDVLTVDTIPLHALSISDCQLPIECYIAKRQSAINNWRSAMLLSFLMRCVLAATAAELTELQTISRSLLVLGRYVIATLAISALQHNIVTRHNSPSVLPTTHVSYLSYLS